MNKQRLKQVVDHIRASRRRMRLRALVRFSVSTPLSVDALEKLDNALRLMGKDYR